MRRTQIYLDEATDRQLRQKATMEDRSVAALVREALGAYLAQPDVTIADDPIHRLIGAFDGLDADAALHHDRDLYGESARDRFEDV